jgi:hypothetical protein
MKLISMVDFVVLQNQPKKERISDEGFGVYAMDFYHSVSKYAEFLKQPLELGMFIPCVDGTPIEEPEQFRGYVSSTHKNPLRPWQIKECEIYQQAKERVLFEGCDIRVPSRYRKLMNQYSCIEDFMELRELTLTPSAIKQLGL